MDNMQLIHELQQINKMTSVSHYKRDVCAVAATALSTLQAENEKLRAVNERLGKQLHAAQRDIAELDSCEVCGWYDSGSCRNPQKKTGSCFAWRGAERARMWEET